MLNNQEVLLSLQFLLAIISIIGLLNLKIFLHFCYENIVNYFSFTAAKKHLTNFPKKISEKHLRNIAFKEIEATIDVMISNESILIRFILKNDKMKKISILISLFKFRKMKNKH